MEPVVIFTIPLANGFTLTADLRPLCGGSPGALGTRGVHYTLTDTSDPPNVADGGINAENAAALIAMLGAST